MCPLLYSPSCCLALAATRGGTKSMPDRTVEGSWSQPSLAGGCPKHDSWQQNPQYRLVPQGSEAQQCEVTLSCGANLRIGFVVLRPAGALLMEIWMTSRLRLAPEQAELEKKAAQKGG